MQPNQGKDIPGFIAHHKTTAAPFLTDARLA
jgi:hypothetical protein